MENRGGEERRTTEENKQMEIYPIEERENSRTRMGEGMGEGLKPEGMEEGGAVWEGCGGVRE